MKRTKRIIGFLFVTFFSSWLFYSCRIESHGSSTDSSAPTFSASKVSLTQMITDQTVQAFPIVTLPVGAPLFPTVSFLPEKTETPNVAPSPFEVDSLLPAECNQVLMYDNYPYTMNECKLPMVSPDGKYLAYTTLVLQMVNEGVYPLESIRVMEIKTGQYEGVHVVKPRNHIGFIEWSLSGKLIFWESSVEGPGVLFVYDPVALEMLAAMRAYRGTALQWNIQRTAFYSARSGGYGADNCVGELNGYDFQYNHPFPDLYEVFNVEKTKEGDPPYDYVVGDSFAIEPFGWSQDGKHLWVSVAFLDWQGETKNEYLVGPRQVGVFELSDTEVRYITLAADDHLDYFFEGPSTDPDIGFQIYQPRNCPLP